MRPPQSVSFGKILGTIVKKDLRLYGRNKVYLFLTVLSLVCFGALFRVIPDTVDETITLAVSPPMHTIIYKGKEALRKLGTPEENLQELDRADLTRRKGWIWSSLRARRSLSAPSRVRSRFTAPKTVAAWESCVTGKPGRRNPKVCGGYSSISGLSFPILSSPMWPLVKKPR